MHPLRFPIKNWTHLKKVKTHKLLPYQFWVIYQENFYPFITFSYVIQMRRTLVCWKPINCYYESFRTILSNYELYGHCLKWRCEGHLPSTPCVVIRTKCRRSWRWAQITTPTRVWVRWKTFLHRLFQWWASSESGEMSTFFLSTSLVGHFPTFPNDPRLLGLTVGLISNLCIWRDFYHEPTHVSRQKHRLGNLMMKKKSLNTTLKHLTP